MFEIIFGVEWNIFLLTCYNINLIKKKSIKSNNFFYVQKNLQTYIKVVCLSFVAVINVNKLYVNVFQ